MDSSLQKCTAREYTYLRISYGSLVVSVRSNRLAGIFHMPTRVRLAPSAIRRNPFPFRPVCSDKLTNVGRDPGTHETMHDGQHHGRGVTRIVSYHLRGDGTIPQQTPIFTPLESKQRVALDSRRTHHPRFA